MMMDINQPPKFLSSSNVSKADAQFFHLDLKEKFFSLPDENYMQLCEKLSVIFSFFHF